VQPPFGRGCTASSAVGIRGPTTARPWVRPHGDTSPPEVLPETSRHRGWMGIRGWRRWRRRRTETREGEDSGG
jgi:hypothetical protein